MGREFGDESFTITTRIINIRIKNREKRPLGGNCLFCKSTYNVLKFRAGNREDFSTSGTDFQG
jgi:hypothetical protein